jgi:16S rRNA (uracil1498-N3)-methyltransferase
MAKSRHRSRFREPPRLVVAKLAEGELHLEGESAHYLCHVLRLGPGDRVLLFDGHNRQAEAQVRSVQRAGVLLEVGAAQPLAALACALTVGLPPPRGERADWAVEKLTEIGVARIVWITTARGQARHGNRIERWQRLAAAAAQQARRASLPELEGPIPFAELLTHETEARWIGDARGAPLRRQVLTRPPASALLALGPEGGFTTEELASAERAGYGRVSLGPLTMRVETAAVVGAGIIMNDSGVQA